MTDTEFTKETAEKIDFGGMAISLVKCVLLDPNKLDSLLEIIQQIKTDINDKAPFCRLTRLIIITADYDEQVAKWQLSLNKPVLTSTDSNATAIGKALTWGDGKPKTTYSIIIISEAIVVGLMRDDNSFFKGIIAHEFGHVHDDFLRLNAFGDQSNSLNTWSGIKREMAENLWSEFFAESIASTYVIYRETYSDSSIELAVTLAKSAHEAITQRIENCRTHQDVNDLFRFASSELSKTCNQFGRVAGLISGHSDFSKLEKIKDELSSISDGWQDVFYNIYVEVEIINSVEKMYEANFTNLQMVIEKLFNLKRIYPEETEKGFLISIH